MTLARSRPSAAERARTVLGHASPVVVEGGDAREVVDVLGVDADGSLVMLIAQVSPLAARVAGHAVRCRVHAALVSPIPGPDRVLDEVTAIGHVWIAGDVGAVLEVVIGDRPAEMVMRTEASVLLRVKLTQLQVGGERVDLDSYARGRPDPLAAGSNDFVEHLVRGHPTELLQLAHLFDPEEVAGIRAFAPVRVDRFGLTFRVDRRAGSTMARLDFAEALRGTDELPAAMHELQLRAAQVASCPFSGQPRSSTPPAQQS